MIKKNAYYKQNSTAPFSIKNAIQLKCQNMVLPQAVTESQIIWPAYCLPRTLAWNWIGDS